MIQGCLCDPPGSGEEYCSGHCYLRAEIKRLNQAADMLAEEREGWKARAEQLRQEGLRLAADYATQVTVLEHECDQYQKKLTSVWKEVEQLRARLGE